MAKDLHARPFDESTLQKLNIFEQYTKTWLPTFIMLPYCPKIYIFDFFAGPGYSSIKQPGSPIRILRQIDGQFGNILKTNTTVIVYLNEYDLVKSQQLKKSVSDYISSNRQLSLLQDKKLLKVVVAQKDISEIFPQLKKGLGSAPALMFFDQYGVKFLSDDYIIPLLNSSTTDFLFFVSSSFVSRFGNEDAFKKHLNIDMEVIRSKPYQFIHRALLEELRSKIPTYSNMRLYPFSIKKGKNIYGIIFGTSHLRGADKFLEVAWKENNQNGEANFDINDDSTKSQPNLFSDDPNFVELPKIASFQNQLEQLILQRNIMNNVDVYIYTINCGHLPKHATEVVKKLKKNGIISYDSRSPLVTYQATHVDKRIIQYIKNESH